MAGGSRGTPTGTRTLDSFNRVKLMGRGCTPGRMERCMMGSGIKGSSTDMESGWAQGVTRILESGTIQKLMGMEFIYGHREIGMRASGNNASNMDTVQTLLITATVTQVNTSTVNPMASENIPGKMVKNSKGNSSRANAPLTENGETRIASI